jgi:CheY-like chemotaxis protein
MAAPARFAKICYTDCYPALVGRQLTDGPRKTTRMSYKLLIVDDSKLARMVMVSALRRLRPDWQVTEATNADEALAAVAGGAIDIALVDFNMPGTDGLDLVAKIRGIQATMPVAIVSANMQDEIIARARELHAAFVAKPLTDEALGAFLSGAALRLRKTAS